MYFHAKVEYWDFFKQNQLKDLFRAASAHSFDWEFHDDGGQ